MTRSVILRRLIVVCVEILIGRSSGARRQRIIPRVSTFSSPGASNAFTPPPPTIQLNQTLSRPNWTFLDAAASPRPDPQSSLWASFSHISKTQTVIPKSFIANAKKRMLDDVHSTVVWYYELS